MRNKARAHPAPSAGQKRDRARAHAQENERNISQLPAGFRPVRTLVCVCVCIFLLTGFLITVCDLSLWII